MKETEADSAIARALAEQRSRDERLAPEFHSLLGRSRPSNAGWRSALPLAAMLLLLAGFLWIGSRIRSAALRTHAVATTSIAEWKPPTDSLLETPGIELFRATPTLESSVPGSSQVYPGRTRRQPAPEGKS